MIRSMTAFARISAPSRQGQWVAEIRSVNHRYFEFSLRLPPALYSLESRVRELVQRQIPRGKVTVAITQNGSEDPVQELALDEDVVKFYVSAMSRLKRRFKLGGEVAVGDLMVLPRIFAVKKSDEDPEQSWSSLLKILKRALAQAVKAKEVEGSKLAADIRGRLHNVARAIGKIEMHASGNAERYFKKLKERMNQLLSEKEKDPERIYREAAFIAERSDISEEIVRMKSHLDLFEKRLKANSEVGRELDFLCQEMNREVNTMGSKAQLFEVSTETVFVKGELEKIREQVQNIE